MQTTCQPVRPRPSKLRRRVAAAAALLAAAALHSAAATAAAADPLLAAASGGRPISSLVVGDHLEVGIAGAAPSTGYQVRLLDEDGAEVVTAGLTTDAAGNAAPVLLWIYSGVVGCDLGADPDAGAYRFVDFGEAETALGGKTFVLEALDSDAALAATLVLPLVATARELPYFADAEGCLRYHFKDTETVYLALRHPNRATPARRIFLTGPGGYPIGAALADVRVAGGSQSWTLPATGNPAVVEIWSGASTALGSYSGHCRWESGSSPTVFRSDTRIGIERYTGGPTRILEGIMITVDGCPGCVRP